MLKYLVNTSLRMFLIVKIFLQNNARLLEAVVIFHIGFTQLMFQIRKLIFCLVTYVLGKLYKVFLHLHLQLTVK